MGARLLLRTPGNSRKRRAPRARSERLAQKARWQRQSGFVNQKSGPAENGALRIFHEGLCVGFGGGDPCSQHHRSMRRGLLKPYIYYC